MDLSYALNAAFYKIKLKEKKNLKPLLVLRIYYSSISGHLTTR